MSLPEEDYDDEDLVSYRCPQCGEALNVEPEGCRDPACPAWRYFQELDRTKER